MNIIKIILGILALIFGAMLVFWLFGAVYSLLGYAFWIAVIGAVGYGGYKLFKKAESKTLGAGSDTDYLDARDYNMSWEEYERKYLSK